MLKFLKKLVSSTSQPSPAKASQQPDAAAIKQEADTAIRAGSVMKALDLYKQAIAIDPQMAKAHVMCGHIYCGLKQYKLAETYLTTAIELAPEVADSYYLLGTIALNEKDYENAISLFEKSIELDPQQPFAYRDLCMAFFSNRNLPKAEAIAHQGISLYPDFPDLHMHRGNTLAFLQRAHEALACYDQVEALIKETPGLCYNRAAVYLSINHFDKALQLLERAQELSPGYIDAAFEESIIRLLKGDFERGWPKFESRWQVERLGLGKINSTSPRWKRLDSLTNKTIMLAAEQGFGDTFQFIRYVKLVSDAKPKGIIVVVFSAQVELMQQLKTIPSVTHVITEYVPPPPHDYYCPLMSLPLAFGTTIETIPNKVPYLHCDKAYLEKWDRELGARRRPLRVGLTWSGNPKHTNDHNRSVHIEHLKKIVEFDAEFVVLQKDINEEGRLFLDRLENTIVHRPDIKTFSDTAALIELVDVVISVDTSILHLAAAMGKPVWVMLPFAPDWRWMYDTDKSPWYPTVRLFRQKTQGDWASVIDPIVIALSEFNKV
ncbi:tetratricopeptide repeat protein [Undibacterium sp. MH2W]|uniref:tetratricopeptide repeat-containing glycosyltransferase family protein n=1 Tax=Undibacterium sp. MH2W TaxID=3413044 RepID=UPI003BF3BF88